MATSYNTTHCIYRIVCFYSGYLYIGRTSNSSKRCDEHFKSLEKGTHHNIRLQSAYNKYGRDSFYFEVIENGLTREQAIEREQYWIAHLNTYLHGYNMSKGGENAGIVQHACEWNGVEYESIAACARVTGYTEKSMGRYIHLGYVCDNDIPLIGKPVTYEGVDYPSVSAAAKAYGVSLPTMSYRVKNQNRLLVNRPKPPTKRDIQKQRAVDNRRISSFLGKHHTTESRLKMSESHAGKINSEETRRKISKSNTGKKRSEESRQRMREAARLREMRKHENQECILDNPPNP